MTPDSPRYVSGLAGACGAVRTAGGGHQQRALRGASRVPPARRARLGGRAHGAPRDRTTVRTPSCGSSPPVRCAACSPTCRRRATPRSRSRSAATSTSASARSTSRRPRCAAGETAVLGALEGRLAWARASATGRSRPQAVARLQYELSVIQDLGFPEYFLVVKDIVDFAQSRGIRCSGTGERRRPHRHVRARHHGCGPDRGTICSSSGSSTPSGARCPTSTWTSTRAAATR